MGRRSCPLQPSLLGNCASRGWGHKWGTGVGSLLGRVELRGCAFPPHPEFLESLEPDLPALRAMGLHLWAVGSDTRPAGISDFLAEASAEVDGPVPGYLSAPQNMTDTCLYIFTSGTTGEHIYPPESKAKEGRGLGTGTVTSWAPRPLLHSPQGEG